MSSYRCTFQMGIERALEYRVNFTLNLFSAVFPIIMQTFLWKYLYQDASIAFVLGYSYGEIMVYTLLASLVSKVVSTGFEYAVNYDIKYGGLNKYLVKPFRYGTYRMCLFFGEKVVQCVILFCVTGVILAFSVFSWNIPFSVIRVVLFLLALVLGILLNFYIFYCIALFSFWLTDVNLLFGTCSIVIVVVSGGVFPMDIFGKTVTYITKILPFAYTTQFPVNIINGRYDGMEIFHGLLLQMLWLVLFLYFSKVLWKQGLKRYSAVGN